MRLNILALLLLSLAAVSFAQAALPQSHYFFGNITADTGVSMLGQTLTATVGATSTTATTAVTTAPDGTTYNYNVMVNRAPGDTTNTTVLFSINSYNFMNSTFVHLGRTHLNGQFPAAQLPVTPTPSTPPGTGGSTGGSSGTGSGGGAAGGAGATGSGSSANTVSVDIGGGTSCNISVTREINSGSGRTELTTTLQNNGGGACTISAFDIADTFPENFTTDLSEVNFSINPASKSGQIATWRFYQFRPGESIILIYTFPREIAPAKIREWGLPTITLQAGVAPEGGIVTLDVASTGVIGMPITITVKKGGVPLAGATIEITTPQRQKITLVAGPDGTVSFTPTLAGTYTYAVPGYTLAAAVSTSVLTEAAPPPTPAPTPGPTQLPPEQPPAPAQGFPWLTIVLVVAGIAVIGAVAWAALVYFKGRKKGI
jgi:hypothetical protein